MIVLVTSIARTLRVSECYPNYITLMEDLRTGGVVFVKPFESIVVILSIHIIIYI